MAVLCTAMRNTSCSCSGTTAEYSPMSMTTRVRRVRPFSVIACCAMSKTSLAMAASCIQFFFGWRRTLRSRTSDFLSGLQKSTRSPSTISRTSFGHFVTHTPQPMQR